MKKLYYLYRIIFSPKPRVGDYVQGSDFGWTYWGKVLTCSNYPDVGMTYFTVDANVTIRSDWGKPDIKRQEVLTISWCKEGCSNIRLFYMGSVLGETTYSENMV